VRNAADNLINEVKILLEYLDEWSHDIPLEQVEIQNKIVRDVRIAIERLKP
jgi:hypothetical protein